MPQEPLRVTPEVLNQQANRLLDHMDDSISEHKGHHDEMAEAATGWIGESARALEGLRTAWEDQRAALHKQIGYLSTPMQEFSSQIVNTEDLNRSKIDKSAP